jgi:putative aminopeptidase FrvX
MNKELLKEILSIPSYSGRELKLVNYICEFLKKNNIPYEVDEMLNIYCTKGDAQTYPCVVAHTDTVHNNTYIDVRTELRKNSRNVLKEAYKGYDKSGKPTGIGGDDKAGVFACLTLLTELPILKAAFFVSEEIGCIGSLAADPEFFKNVGYAIQFDAPFDWMVSEISSGVPLFDRDSKFFTKVNNILVENTSPTYGSHPYTDVYALKKLFDFSCINISIGYYDYHTANEYVVLEDVEKGIKIGKEMIESLGCDKYEKKHIPVIRPSMKRGLI